MRNNIKSLNRVAAIALIMLAVALALPSIALATNSAGTASDSSIDVGGSLQKTQDGGYIVVSTKETKNADGDDVWLTKTDDNGKKIWTKSYSFGPGEDDGASVLQTRDGGYAVAGYTNSKDATYDVLLMKTDSSGQEQWRKTFSLGSGDDTGTDVKETDDGGFVIVGKTGSNSDGGSDILLLKADAKGDEQWKKTFSIGPSDDVGVAVLQTKDGNFAVAGFTNTTNSNYDGLLMKVDSKGDKIWSKTYSLGAGDDISGDIKEIPDGFILAGRTSYKDASGDALLIKTDADGNQIWTKTFSLGTGNEGSSSVQQAADGGYVLAGFSDSNTAGSSDVLLLKTDADGKEKWQKTFSFGAGNDLGTDVLGIDDGYVIAGITATDLGRNVVLVKTDLDGEEQWRSSFTGEE